MNVHFAVVQTHKFRVISYMLVEISVVCKKEAMNSEQCSELDTTSTAMMVFNNGCVVIIMDTSSMMDNTLQVTIQSSTAKHSIYYYFSSAFEVSMCIQPLQKLHT